MKTILRVAIGSVIAAFAASFIHAAVVTDAVFRRSQDVPSAIDRAPSAQYAAAVERAREFVRTAIVEQALPGVSVAVGMGDAIVWAEGFGWRDVLSRTPVTSATRFNIGTAASAVSAAAAPLGLANTGVDSAADWSPEHIGEPEEDFPLFRLVRDVVFRPIGLAPAKPLAGERATFYVPRSGSNPTSGRRLMYMRDLACCADGMAFYSTPSDLVRIARAANRGNVNGELAGGMVMSLVMPADGTVIAVTSNVAHADTSSLAQRIGEAFRK